MALASRALNVGAGLEDKLAGDDDHQAIEAPPVHLHDREPDLISRSSRSSMTRHELAGA